MPPPVFRLVRRAGGLARLVPMAATLAALAGVAVWGHRTDWKFSPVLEPVESVRTDGFSRARFGATLPIRPDVPTALQREVVLDFDSAAAVDAAGITIAPVWVGPIADTVEAGGEVAFDPARLSRLTTRAQGAVWRVTKTAGDPVAAGEVLALIDAVEVGRAKAEFHQALVQVRLRERTMANIQASGKAVSAQLEREAEAALRDAETRMLAAAQSIVNLGFTFDPADYRTMPLDAAVERMRLLGVPPETPGLDPKTATANLLPIRSPMAGVVLSADAVAGEMTEPGQVLFVVVDPRRVWITFHVRPDDARRVAAGQSVRFRADGSSVDSESHVTWVGTTADESTRTVPVRAELANDAGRLRAGTLGQGRVILRREPNAVLVPRDAVQLLRGWPVVFVRDPNFLKPGGPKAFRARPVRLGARDAENVEVLVGVQAGEVVATRGSGLLLNELNRALNGSETGR